MLDITNLGSVTSPFGERNAPTKGASKNHKGIDIVLKTDNIPAVNNGVVIENSYNNKRGNYVSVKQSDGKIVTYEHLASKSPILKGQTVNKAQVIGVQGKTGVATGKHLHIEVKDQLGNYIDPVQYFKTGESANIIDANDASIIDKKSSDVDLDFIGNIVRIVLIILVIGLGVLFFVKAFDISIPMSPMGVAKQAIKGGK